MSMMRESWRISNPLKSGSSTPRSSSAASPIQGFMGPSSRGRRAAPIGNGVPRSLGGQVGAEQVGACSTGLAGNAVAVPDQATNFQRREAIEVGPSLGRLPLNFRVQGGQILLRLDDLGNA